MGTYLGKHPIGAIVPLAYRYLEKKEAEGTSSVSLIDSIKAPLFDLNIEGNSVQRILPKEYQQVEHLTNSGTQRIDTGIIPTNSTSIDITYQSLMPTGTSQYIAGSRAGATAVVEYAINGSSSNVYWDVRLNGATTTITNVNRMSNKYRSYLQLNNGVGTWTLTHTTTNTTYTKNISGAKVKATANLFLFAYNNIDANTHMNLRIYACKIYEAGVLVRDFIPCYRKLDGVAGMYDLVEDKFYTNAGTGSFAISGDYTSEPTPDTPSEIISVGEKTKNLIDVSKAETGSLMAADGANFEATNRARTPFVYLKKGTYTISMNAEIKATTMFFYSQPIASGSFISKYATSPTVENGRRVATFTVEQDCYMRCVFIPEDESKTTDLSAETLKNYNVMIEEPQNLFNINNTENGTLNSTNGTDLSATQYPNRCRSGFIKLSAGSYIVSFKELISTGNYLHLYSSNNVSSWIKSQAFTKSGNVSKFTLDSDCYIRFTIQPIDTSSDLVLNTETLKQHHPHLLKSTTATDYEPYGYKIPINICGENLANENTIQENKLIGNSSNGIINDSTTYNTLYMEVEQGRTYVFKNFVRANGTTLRGCFYDSNGAWVSAFEETTVTIPSGVKYVGRSFSKEEQNVALYKTYSIKEIYIKEPLRKIGDYTDKLDYKNGKVIRKIKEIELNGKDEEWETISGNAPYVLKTEDRESNYSKIDIVCSHFQTVSNSASWVSYSSMLSVSSGKPNYIAFRYTEMANLNEFLNWLGTNKPNVSYVLATPTEETIEVPTILTLEGVTNLEIATEIEPSYVKLIYGIDAY